MRIIIIGGGIGGLVTALMLHDVGIECEVFEQASVIRELGVGINILPHAVEALRTFGLIPRLSAVSVETDELFYLNRQGQEVWREPRGLAAGFDVPQFSIHRGYLLREILAIVFERLGPNRVHCDHRLEEFVQDDNGVVAKFRQTSGNYVEVCGTALIGADGIHSVVRHSLFPQEGPPRWNQLTLWRGARSWKRFLSGRSMVIAGGLTGKVAVYPIAPGEAEDELLTNWAVVARTDNVLPGAQDWSSPARFEDFEAFCRDIRIPYVDMLGLMASTAPIWRYPMTDRDPLPFWSKGAVTLLGDAAHPMYPVGSNGASQAILDAVELRHAFASGLSVQEAFAHYQKIRLPTTSQIVISNRQGGPEGVIDLVEGLAPEGFHDIEAVLPYSDRETFVRGYAQRAGFSLERVREQRARGMS